MSINTQTTVGELVAERPGRARLFEKLGIEYCCGGKKPLESACVEAGLDAKTVILMLEASETSGSTAEERDWASAPISELVDHIITTHHQYLRQELPRVSNLIDKVVNAHGSRAAKLSNVRAVFGGLKSELDSHMWKEENILFPACKEIGDNNGILSGPFGSVSQPIAVMEMEHDRAGRALVELRELTKDYTAPDWACNTYRAMLDGLLSIEKDTHEHISKENNILFPRVLELESKQQKR